MYINFQTFQKEYLNLDSFKIIETDNLFFLWKKAFIPSSFWKEKSVLDLLEENKLDTKFTENQKNNFTKENEYWLLNRLDNDTSWFLYFAKNQEFYKKFKNLQKEGKIDKVYYAKVEWIFDYKSIEIDDPIMHKNKTKMIVIKNKQDEKKWRWKKHFVKTYVEKIFYNEKENTTWLKVIIKKWIRHQIRVHLASLWLPIVWDKLYWKKVEKLFLFSVGIRK